MKIKIEGVIVQNMAGSEFLKTLEGIEEKTREILGPAKVEDKGWEVEVLLANKTYALEDKQIEDWVTRPAIVADRLGGPLEAGPLVRGSGRLNIYRGFKTDLSGDLTLARVVELQVRHRKEERALWWVYQIAIYKAPSGMPWVATSFFKDRILDEYRSPVFGSVQGRDDPAVDDQMRAFNRFLEYALKAEPIHSSWDRHRLGL